MAKYSVNTDGLKNSVSSEESVTSQLIQIADNIETAADSSAMSGCGYSELRRTLRALAEDVREEKSSVDSLKKALEEITDLYLKTELELSVDNESINEMKSNQPSKHCKSN